MSEQPAPSPPTDLKMNKQLLQQRLDELRSKYNLPALALAVSLGKEEFVLVSGLRKSGDPAPVTAHDKFHMGSNGKSITAELIHELAAEGHFTPSTTLKDALPDVLIAPEWQNITISQLLTHTSGLSANYPDIEALRALSTSVSPQDARRLIVAEVLKSPPQGEVSKGFSYSNLGYVILGAIAEQATGIAYEDLVSQRVFDKLGMVSAGFGTPSDGEPATQPWGHVHNPDNSVQPVAADNPPAYAPAGTMHASLSDWMTFAKSRMQYLPAHGSNMGGGNEYTDAGFIKSGEVYSHDGSNGLNYARIVILPKENAVFIIASNDGGAQAQLAINELTNDVLKQIKPSRPRTTEIPSPKPEAPKR